MDDTYLFIDGKYLTEIHRSALLPMFGEVPEIDFQQVKGQAQAARAYFYDCLNDIQNERETNEEFAKRKAKQEAYFAKIRSQIGYHLRLGTLTGRARNLRQKEVDVQLAVDMLTHGLNGNIRKAVLVAGDLDFRPIVDALVRNGVFVDIWYEKRTASQGLYWSADYGRELGFIDFFGFSDPAFTAKHPLPRVIRGVPANPRNLNAENGHVNGKFIWLALDGGTYKLFVPQWDPHSLTVESENRELLEKYFTAVYGPIEWERR